MHAAPYQFEFASILFTLWLLKVLRMYAYMMVC